VRGRPHRRPYAPAETSLERPADDDGRDIAPPTSPERPDDDGRAILELIVLGVLVMIPILYIAMSLLTLQATTFGASQAARDAARLLDNAPTAAVGQARALAAARQTLVDQHVGTEGLRIRYIPTGGDCEQSAGRAPDLSPGAVFDICVIVPLVLPLLPAEITAANTVTGVFTLHVGEFREAR
jgi:hypothetical protein